MFPQYYRSLSTIPCEVLLIKINNKFWLWPGTNPRPLGLPQAWEYGDSCATEWAIRHYCFHTYAYSLMISWEYFLVMTKYLVKSTVRHWSTEFWLLLHVAFEPIVAQTVQCYATAIQSKISQHMHENSPCSIFSFLLFDTLVNLYNFFLNLLGGNQGRNDSGGF